MDILYTGTTDGFVLVSSDSDFTRLAIRLREAGKRVIGIGERKTPNAFIVACDKFIYIEVIRANAEEAKQNDEEPVQKIPEPVKMKTSPQPKRKNGNIPQMSLMSPTPSPSVDDDGFVFMGELGNLLLEKAARFRSLKLWV
jgi:hypothetical protein